MKESSSELSTLAAQVLRRGACPTSVVTADEYNELLATAKSLAGSVLSQDETPGGPDVMGMAFAMSIDDADKILKDAFGEKPAPNAPEPSVMREEMVNAVFAKAASKISRNTAEKIVDDILERQMRFYSQMADPELTASPMEQMQLVADTQGIINALISVGAQGVEHMTSDVRAKWQRLAERARELSKRMSEMFS